MKPKKMKVYMTEHSHIYHKRKDCPSLVRMGIEPEPKRIGFKTLFRPCRICAVEL